MPTRATPRSATSWRRRFPSRLPPTAEQPHRQHPTATLNGRGWINVHDIRSAGQTNALPITWLDDQRWQITLPLQAGANDLLLLAFDYHGAQVGQDSITVTTTVSEFPQRDFLRITELMYHPPAPGAAEIAAGFADGDDFELSSC